MALLDDALIAHLGVSAGAHPVVLPTAFGVDPAGPDDGGTLYLHGSVAAGWLAPALEHDVCVTVTELDGLVLARTGFHHSMNYRSAVVIGTASTAVAASSLRVAGRRVADRPGAMWSTTASSARARSASSVTRRAVPITTADR